MTMDHRTHPEDERLAALAGGDPDATRDAALHAHVDGCAQCRAVVDDVVGLRVALAQLPDVAPSRPLQLIPPVPAAAPSGGALAWLRRLAAPAMAVGAGLVLVGTVGATGLFGGGSLGLFSGAASGATAPPDHEAAVETNNAGRDSGAETSQPEPLEPGSPGAAPRSTDEAAVPDATEDAGSPMSEDGQPAGFDDRDDDVTGTGQLPWVVLILAGGGLAITGLALRFAIQPRAG
jgi:hypothetical protein